MIETESIPNWSFFEAAYIQIQLFPNEDEDIYSAGLFIALDDGLGEEINYNMTLSTHLEHTDKVQLAKMVFIYASTIFPYLDPIVKVWNFDVTESEEIDLRTEKMTPEGHAIQ